MTTFLMVFFTYLFISFLLSVLTDERDTNELKNFYYFYPQRRGLTLGTLLLLMLGLPFTFFAFAKPVSGKIFKKILNFKVYNGKTQ